MCAWKKLSKVLCFRFLQYSRSYTQTESQMIQWSFCLFERVFSTFLWYATWLWHFGREQIYYIIFIYIYIIFTLNLASKRQSLDVSTTNSNWHIKLSTSPESRFWQIGIRFFWYSDGAFQAVQPDRYRMTSLTCPSIQSSENREPESVCFFLSVFWNMIWAFITWNSSFWENYSASSVFGWYHYHNWKDETMTMHIVWYK